MHVTPAVKPVDLPPLSIPEIPNAGAFAAPVAKDGERSASAVWPRDPRAFQAAITRVAGVAAEHAEAVDRAARFPDEALAALRDEGLLGAMIPAHLGGLGFGISRVAAACCTLGQACASTAMIFAMHQIQVACLLRHAPESAWHLALLRHIATDARLVASVTSEVGVGGQMRISRCAIVTDQDGIQVEKHSTAISYGAYADVLLLTARRGPNAAENDQVLLALDRHDVCLKPTKSWDSLGMRGTCTDAFSVRAHATAEQILPDPFSRIASETMVPVSHLLWASVWLGIATESVQRARMALRAQLRDAAAAGSGEIPLPSGATRLAEAMEQVLMLQARVADAVHRFDNEAWLGGDAFCLQPADLSALKTSVSEGCLSVVQQALLASGFAGYQNTGRYSLSRHLRDLQSAPLMISNDRMRESSARLLLAQRPVLGLQ
jgi:acyl-CoA dehydrogenase